MDPKDFSKQVPGSRRSESCGTAPTCFDPRTEDSHLEELQPQWLGYPKIIQNTMTDITVDVANDLYDDKIIQNPMVYIW